MPVFGACQSALAPHAYPVCHLYVCKAQRMGQSVGRGRGASSVIGWAQFGLHRFAVGHPSRKVPMLLRTDRRESDPHGKCRVPRLRHYHTRQAEATDEPSNGRNRCGQAPIGRVGGGRQGEAFRQHRGRGGRVGGLVVDFQDNCDSALPVSGWSPVPQTIIPGAQERLIPPSARRNIRLFGGLGLSGSWASLFLRTVAASWTPGRRTDPRRPGS